MDTTANKTPTQCGNGEYLSTLIADSCSTCTAGYYCKSRWTDRIKVSPGLYAAASASSPTECPEGSSCSTSAPSACSSNYQYSALGEMTCHSAPTFLRFTTSNTRSPTGMTSFAFGRKTNTSDDDSSSECNTDYCPGDGTTQAAYSGLTLTTGNMDIKTPGEGCANLSYSNGGTDCYDCSPGGSDRSNCQDGSGGNRTNQFAEAFYNGNNEREGVVIN